MTRSQHAAASDGQGTISPLKGAARLWRAAVLLGAAPNKRLARTVSKDLAAPVLDVATARAQGSTWCSYSGPSNAADKAGMETNQMVASETTLRPRRSPMIKLTMLGEGRVMADTPDLLSHNCARPCRARLCGRGSRTS